MKSVGKMVELKLLKSLFIDPPKYQIGQVVNFKIYDNLETGIIAEVELDFYDSGFLRSPDSSQFYDDRFVLSPDGSQKKGSSLAWRYTVIRQCLFYLSPIDSIEPMIKLNFEELDKDSEISLIDEAGFARSFCQVHPKFWVGDIVACTDLEDEGPGYHVCFIGGMRYIPPKFGEALGSFNGVNHEICGWSYFLYSIDAEAFGDAAGLFPEAQLTLTNLREEYPLKLAQVN